MEKKDISIIYHAECPDGLGAAYAAWKKFGDSAAYFPLHNRATPPEEISGTDVYTLDYSFTPEVIAEWKPKVNSWHIVDHHKTNEPAVKLADDSLYDLSHSGAVLAWNYFHPKAKVPLLLSYIEDGDLWKFAMPHSRELLEIVGLSPSDFKQWERLITEFEDPALRENLIEKGTLLREKIHIDIERILVNAEETEFEGYKCLMVNSAQYVSEIGHELSKKLPPIGIIWSRRKKRVVVSLRSDGSVDVSVLAQKYGGGGHPSAAAFSWEQEKFLELKKAED